MERSQLGYRDDGKGGHQSHQARAVIWFDLFQASVQVDGLGSSKAEAKENLKQAVLKLKVKVDEMTLLFDADEVLTELIQEKMNED